MPFNSDTARRAGSKPKRRDLITQQIVAALGELAPEKQVTKARAIADMLVTKAVEGDIGAAREVLDRVEGKPVQTNENFNHTETARLSDDDIARLLSERLLNGGVGSGVPAKTNGSAKPH